MQLPEPVSKYHHQGPLAFIKVYFKGDAQDMNKEI